VRNTVQLIAYVDRLGGDLRGVASMLGDEFSGLFGGVHLLPYFTHYDGADAGFDPVDHTQVDERLGDWDALRELATQTYVISDLIVNHVSNESSQFQDVMFEGEASDYWDFFLRREDVFPPGSAADGPDKIYRPRPGLPFTTITLDDDTSHDFWTTFSAKQIDIDVESEAGLAYLESIIRAFSRSGIRAIRLDAIGYAIKRAGTECFMLPETFEFIESMRESAARHDIDVLVEIHSHHQTQIDIAGRVSLVYDFALPPLVLHALFNADATALKAWLAISPQNCITVLDTHDGIGIVDVAGDSERPGLLNDSQIEQLVEQINIRTNGESRLASGNAADNLDIYQVNTTYYDALGRSDRLYLLARAVQFFSPGIPQVYYMGLLAGQNDVELLKKTRVGRDINRHYYTREEVRAAMLQPVVESLCTLIRIRNESDGFNGTFESRSCPVHQLHLCWHSELGSVELLADFDKQEGVIKLSAQGEYTEYKIADTVMMVKK